MVGVTLREPSGHLARKVGASKEKKVSGLSLVQEILVIYHIVSPKVYRKYAFVYDQLALVSFAIKNCVFEQLLPALKIFLS